jgi:urea transport system permease protein
VLSALVDGLFSGLSIGSVLLLSALGLAIVFGLMGVINMAHGELMMLGAYTTVLVQASLKDTPLFDSYIFIALIAAFGVTALFGLLLERTVIRFLYGRPLETLLATWGVSLMLQQLVRSVSWQFVAGGAIALGLTAVSWAALFHSGIGVRWANTVKALLALISGGIGLTVSDAIAKVYGLAFMKPWFGAQNQDVTAPGWLRGGWKMTLGSTASDTVQLSYVRIFIIVLTILCLIAVYFFLNRTDWGLRIRSVTQNRSMSACLGIPTKTVDALTFAIGSGLAGVAGCAVSLLGSVGPNTGQNYIIDTFMVVVVGGVGNLVGSIVAAMLIGMSSYMYGTFAGQIPFIQDLSKTIGIDLGAQTMAKVVVFALIVVFLQFKPAGLFPQKGRTVDA